MKSVFVVWMKSVFVVLFFTFARDTEAVGRHGMGLALQGDSSFRYSAVELCTGEAMSPQVNILFAPFANLKLHLAMTMFMIH